MFFIVAVLTGILLGLLVPYNLSSVALPYMAVAIVAALDSVFGGIAANLNKKFNMNVFMMGLISNAVLAVLLTYIGDLLGINLLFAAIVVFGVRIFNNLASIRRLTLDIYFERRAHDKDRDFRRRAIAAKAESIEDAEEIEETEPEEETQEIEKTEGETESGTDEREDAGKTAQSGEASEQ